jgi:hypothetical protein
MERAICPALLAFTLGMMLLLHLINSSATLTCTKKWLHCTQDTHFVGGLPGMQPAAGGFSIREVELEGFACLHGHLLCTHAHGSHPALQVTEPAIALQDTQYIGGPSGAQPAGGFSISDDTQFVGGPSAVQAGGSFSIREV